jgi:hypothetical protein|tara:strand:+ start:2004 stop:2390 length:387 start_codon:yes stop_codon:yes gene_type:complete
MRKKLIYLLAMLLLAASWSAQAVKPEMFRTVVSLQVLCTKGGPELLMKQLLDDYNEKPVHAIDLSNARTGVSIQLYVTENKNNPSSTFILHNNSVDSACIFWSAEDHLRTLETESLPAKKPDASKEDV